MSVKTYQAKSKWHFDLNLTISYHPNDHSQAISLPRHGVGTPGGLVQRQDLLRGTALEGDRQTSRRTTETCHRAGPGGRAGSENILTAWQAIGISHDFTNILTILGYKGIERDTAGILWEGV